MAHILVVDDQIELARLFQRALERDDHTVSTASTGEEVLDTFSNRPVDLILLDIMLPGMDGFTVCQTIRAASAIPIIFLSILGSSDHIEQGLIQAGADDYMVKPCTMAELCVRVDALLRRVAWGNQPPVMAEIHTARVQVSRDTRHVIVEGQAIKLAPREHEILVYLMTRANQVVPARALESAIWPQSNARKPRAVHTTICRLRNKIEQDIEQPRYIQTIANLGYRFNSKTSVLLPE